MRKRILLGLLSLALVGLASWQGHELPPEKQMGTDFGPYMPGTVFVKFKPGAHPDGSAAKTGQTGFTMFDKRARDFGVATVATAFPIVQQFPAKTANDLGRIYNVTFDEKHHPRTVAQRLAEDPAVEYAEPRVIYTLDVSPSDPQYSAQAQFARVEAEAGWDVTKGENGSATIAIVDNGTDWQHPDLQNNVWNNPNETINGADDDGNGLVDDVRGWNFANNSNDPSPLTAAGGGGLDSHGTHVAGIAAAVTNNGAGVSSLSWNAKYLPINARCPNSGGVCFGYEGILYAASLGADVINCSWGGSGIDLYSQVLQDIMLNVLEQGSLVVASAGNDGTNNDVIPHYPSDYFGVLGVGGTRPDSDLNSYNYGVSVDVFAPGASILSTFPNGTYNTIGGTSMSSPMTAALAALIKTHQPNFTPHQIREQIRATSDDISAQNNPNRKYGQGRINARRALTEFNHPGLRITNMTVADSGGDGEIDAGELLTLTFDVYNYLEAANNVSVSLTDRSAHATVPQGNSTIASIAKDGTEQVSLQLQIGNNAPPGTLIRLEVEFSSGAYEITEFQRVQVRTAVASHSVNNIVSTVTNEGNIGFTVWEGDSGSEGSGFLFHTEQFLFEGGLLFGTSAGAVSDCVRGEDGAATIQNEDLNPHGPVQKIVPGDKADEETSVVYDDSVAPNPLGVTVHQQTFASNSSDAQNFIIYKYTFTNNGSSDLNDFYAGLFFDWDIDRANQVQDHALYDASRKMSIAQDDGANPTKLVGVRLLTDGGISHRSIDNEEIYGSSQTVTRDGFTAQEKWNFLSGGVQVQQVDNTDISTLTGSGPHTIPAGGSVEVAFALVGANTATELPTFADQALTFWQQTIVPNEPTDHLVPDRFALHQNYPNPFNPTTNIAYTLPQSETVNLIIYNIMGQEVRRLVSGTQAAGTHTVTWDGRDQAGQAVASGTYLYRLTAGPAFVQTNRMMLIK